MLEFLLVAGITSSLYKLLKGLWHNRQKIKKKLKELWEKIKELLPKTPGHGPVDNPSQIPPKELRMLQDPEIDMLVQLLQQMRGYSKSLDRSEIEEAIRVIYEMDLPIFKIARKRLEDAKKTIPVKKFRKKVRQVPKVIEGSRKEEDITIVHIPSPTLEDDYDVVPMTNMNQFPLMMLKTQLALPPTLLIKKMRAGEIPVKQYQKEVKQVRSRTIPTKETITVDEPYLEAYTDMVEITEEPTSQLLYILIDCSSSMIQDDRIVIAAAIAISIIRYGMDNNSEFYHRSFNQSPSRAKHAVTKKEKIKLMAHIIRNSYPSGNTDIEKAIRVAGRKIKRQRNVDRSEILLITDGEDHVNEQWLRKFLGNKILLHTVKIGEYENWSLKENSTTYVRLSDRMDGLKYNASW